MSGRDDGHAGPDDGHTGTSGRTGQATLTAVPPRPPAPEEPPQRPGITRWAADLAMGGRFAVTGGRESWARTIMTAVGVGLGVTLLLFAASVPTMDSARTERSNAIAAFGFGEEPEPGPGTVHVAQADTDFRDMDISGMVLAPDGDRPPHPPGISGVPAAGEMYVSPALKKLLDSDKGKLLRDRFPYRVAGVIGDSGLSGPTELRYYAGITPKQFDSVPSSYHLDSWGAQDTSGDELDPALVLLVVMGCVVLLLPVLIFIATAARFGGERRDRRLAALRLVGADIRMTRRIAAGESLFGSVLGLAVGATLFLLLREAVGGASMMGLSFFTSDIMPSFPLALAIVLTVPASAVAVTLIALRAIAIEPLGVVRNATPKRRRLWWRLLLPLLGIGLLAPLAGGFGVGSSGGDVQSYQAAAGAVLLLIGTTALLPWLVESVVERFGKGPVPWLLATRRLQLSSGTAARAVSGITVAVAGAIALQMLFASVEGQSTEETNQDPNRAQLMVNMKVDNGAQARDAFDRLGAAKGVRSVLEITEGSISDAHSKAKDPADIPTNSLTVAGCPALRELAHITSCRDGDAFIVTRDPEYTGPDNAFAKPGAQVNVAFDDEGMPTPGKQKLWTVPRSAEKVESREDPNGALHSGIFATPGAFDVSDLANPQAVAMLRLDPKVPDADEYVRNTSVTIAPTLDVTQITSSSQSSEFQTIRNVLFIGATATLLLIGASMIVTTLEQLRDRKRLLSVLVAFGTRRSTLSWSILWQTAVPVVLGLALSIAGGLALGVLLLKMVGEGIAVDWAGLAAMTGIGAGVILVVTLASLPPLWRMMRPEGLRTE
ncbi:ABC transporter permease [Streptomyces samsunensis]|uniref:ABC transporter permease n=1 Tax=Streptomyces malaysiensis TaxID=92644 RepID=UPI001581740F|nr:ABC transporter permease [Streptomyces samsunensis]NUH43962.1 ABC transporter permease [Streptomyces samsunensis]